VPFERIDIDSQQARLVFEDLALGKTRLLVGDVAIFESAVIWNISRKPSRSTASFRSLTAPNIAAGSNSLGGAGRYAASTPRTSHFKAKAAQLEQKFRGSKHALRGAMVRR